MARRIEASALRLGMARERTQRTAALFLAMIEERAGVVSDENHRDFLHTGRTAVILLEDACVANEDAVAAAVLFDSRHAALAPAALRLATRSGSGARAVLGELTTPASDDAELIEALVTASDEARLVAVTERLDHARHLHLDDPAGWADFHAQFERVYLPLAQRTHPQLAHRCARWSGMFAERYLRV